MALQREGGAMEEDILCLGLFDSADHTIQLVTSLQDESPDAKLGVNDPNGTQSVDLANVSSKSLHERTLDALRKTVWPERRSVFDDLLKPKPVEIKVDLYRKRRKLSNEEEEVDTWNGSAESSRDFPPSAKHVRKEFRPVAQPVTAEAEPPSAFTPRRNYVPTKRPTSSVAAEPPSPKRHRFLDLRRLPNLAPGRATAEPMRRQLDPEAVVRAVDNAPKIVPITSRLRFGGWSRERENCSTTMLPITLERLAEERSDFERRARRLIKSRPSAAAERVRPLRSCLKRAPETVPTAPPAPVVVSSVLPAAPLAFTALTTASPAASQPAAFPVAPPVAAAATVQQPMPPAAATSTAAVAPFAFGLPAPVIPTSSSLLPAGDNVFAFGGGATATATTPRGILTRRRRR